MSEIGFKMLLKASTLRAKKDFSLQHSIPADSCHRNSISHCALLAGGANGKQCIHNYFYNFIDYLQFRNLCRNLKFCFMKSTSHV